MRPATSTYLGMVARVLGYGRYRANVNLPPDVWLPPDLAGVGTTNTRRSRVRSHGCLWKPESPLKHSHKKARAGPINNGLSWPGSDLASSFFERKGGARKPHMVRQPDRCRPRKRRVRGRRQSRWLLTWPAALL